MEAITATALRSNMKTYLDLVTDSEEIVFVTRSGNEEPVVLMSISEYNSIKETAHLLYTESNRDALAKSIAQHKAGQTVAFNPNEKVKNSKRRASKLPSSPEPAKRSVKK